MTTARFRLPQFWVPAAACLLVALYLYAVQGYSTGYLFERKTLLHDMLQGYKLDGGEWGFGRFIPLIIAALFYTQRKQLLQIPARPDYILGGILLGLGFFFYFGGYKANEKYVGFAAGQILAAGMILWFLGRTWFFKTFWLWVLLGMMWPWRFLIEPIAFPLQLTMVKLTSTFLDLIGVDVSTRGTAILTDTPDPKDGEMIRLNIAAACSGLRSLFALIMIGLVIGYLQLKEDWKRLVLMCGVPLVAVAGNFVRMMMLYFGSKFGGSEFAIGLGEGKESTYHINSGLVVFMVAVVLMLTIVQILNKGAGYFTRRRLVVRSVEKVA